MRRALPWLCLIVALGATARMPAQAHVVLTETDFEAGRNFAAFFKVDEGCDTQATVSLEVRLPRNVRLLELPPKSGWSVTAARVAEAPLTSRRGIISERITAVTWRGRLESNISDQFGLLLRLPAVTGPIYFPVIQRC